MQQSWASEWEKSQQQSQGHELVFVFQPDRGKLSGVQTSVGPQGRDDAHKHIMKHPKLYVRCSTIMKGVS